MPKAGRPVDFGPGGSLPPGSSTTVTSAYAAGDGTPLDITLTIKEFSGQAEMLLAASGCESCTLTVELLALGTVVDTVVHQGAWPELRATGKFGSVLRDAPLVVASAGPAGAPLEVVETVFSGQTVVYPAGFVINDVAFLPEAAPVVGDLNGDSAVNAADLAMLLGAWGPCSGQVDAADLAILLGGWGPC
ncbi:MAG: hypothetical protein SGJ11_13765 [Phycisphaerae bacterium]|nr:hypothetical protein [Phycisphaerae bacterium]